MGETRTWKYFHILSTKTFSILERIDVGETSLQDMPIGISCNTFSILERIDVGETYPSAYHFDTQISATAAP